MEIVDRDRFAAGMAEQRTRFRAARADGMPRAGWKVGINVPEVLRSLGLRHAGIGWLDGRRIHASGSEVPLPSGVRLHLEPELAIRVGRRIEGGGSPADALAAIAAVQPALELVDYALSADHLDAVIAHSMFHAGTVLGEERALADVTDLDLGGRWPELEVAGARAGEPRSDLVPRHLGELLVFVAAFLEAFGERLEAGDTVLSGSFLDHAARIRPGQTACARFGRLGEVRFGAEEAANAAATVGGPPRARLERKP